MHKYDLEFESTKQYVLNHLQNINALCDEIVKLGGFDEGIFYSLFPRAIKDRQLTQFEVPMSRFAVQETEFTDVGLSSHEIAMAFICDQMNKDPKLYALFDDAIRLSSDLDHKAHLQDDMLKTYNDEVYYTISNRSFSRDNVLQCIRRSNALWHSLCLLTVIPSNELPSEKLSPFFINQAVRNVKFIIIAAYDGDGYIVWERGVISC